MSLTIGIWIQRDPQQPKIRRKYFELPLVFAGDVTYPSVVRDCDLSKFLSADCLDPHPKKSLRIAVDGA